jgi:hypothetical protein
MKLTKTDQYILTRKQKDGESCGHPGCLAHVTHPCEACGRIAGNIYSKMLIDQHPILFKEFFNLGVKYPRDNNYIKIKRKLSLKNLIRFIVNLFHRKENIDALYFTKTIRRRNNVQQKKRR